ncbi:hypothetical protein Tco_0707300 [Tanacetum coccineum]|uniref:Uncharacterized protein n=1 Tax=Tanacetum coccineum TaxID=301880 RepID=A0ABQ4Y9T7_9ASTR
MLVCLFLISSGTHKVSQAIADLSWVEDEAREPASIQATRSRVLCDLTRRQESNGKLNGFLENKRDERGTIIKNKAQQLHMGVQGKKTVWDYDEVLNRLLELSNQIFFGICIFHGFQLSIQMDVKKCILIWQLHRRSVYDWGSQVFNCSRPDIIGLAACLCAQDFQVTPRFLTFLGCIKGSLGTTNINQNWVYGILGLSFSFGAFSDSGICWGKIMIDDQNSGGCHILDEEMGLLAMAEINNCWLSPLQTAEDVAAASCCAQQLWTTASLKVINVVPNIHAMGAAIRSLISEETFELTTIRADLLFDDENGVDCFPKQVIWDVLRGPKSTSWEQFGTNIASALVGLATNQKFNFSLMILNGMLGHISNGTPFLMYPRFIQLFLNKQLEGVARPQDFIPSVTLPSKIFTFMRKHSPKFSCRITPLTPPMLEVVTALAAEEEHSTSPHSRAASSARDAQGTPDQSAAQASVSQRTAEVQGTDTSQRTAEVPGTANSQGTAEVRGTAAFQGTAETQGTAIPKSPNDYTPTDASQTSGGDEGLLDLYALNREVRRLKKQTLSQAKQIIKLKTKLKKLSKMVQPVVQHHTLWVESQKHKKRRKKQKKQKKKVSSVKLGRNKEEGTLSEEHYVQDDYTADPFFEDIVDKDAAVTPDLERKSDETEEINIEEKKASDVKSGDTEELDLEAVQSTARQSTITPRTLNFDDEAGPSSPIRPTQNIEPEEQFKVDEVLADISRPRGLSIPGPIQSQPQPQQPSQATDPKDKGKGILIQAEWDAEEERKRLEELKKAKSKTILKKPTSLAQERNQMMNFLKGQGYKNLQKLRYPQMKEIERGYKETLRKRKATFPRKKAIKKKLKLRTETIDALRNYLRIVDFEQNAQDRESQEAISVITEFKVIDSPDGESANTRVKDGTKTIHILVERRILLSRELMIRDAGSWNGS